MFNYVSFQAVKVRLAIKETVWCLKKLSGETLEIDTPRQVQIVMGRHSPFKKIFFGLFLLITAKMIINQYQLLKSR